MISLRLRLVKRLFSGHICFPREIDLFADNVGFCLFVCFSLGKFLVQHPLFGVNKSWTGIKLAGIWVSADRLLPDSRLEYKHDALPVRVFEGMIDLLSSWAFCGYWCSKLPPGEQHTESREYYRRCFLSFSSLFLGFPSEQGHYLWCNMQNLCELGSIVYH